MVGYLKVKELYNYFIEIYIIMNGWVININMRFIIKTKHVIMFSMRIKK